MDYLESGILLDFDPLHILRIFFIYKVNRSFSRMAGFNYNIMAQLIQLLQCLC